MAISTYNSGTGETLYKVYVNVRSKTNTALRAQRKISGCKTAREAEREETRLIRECEREILEKETQGSTWGALVEEYEKYLDTSTDVALMITTRKDYVAAAKKHTMHWWRRAAGEISKTDLRELFAQLKARGMSVSHQRRMKVIINRIFVFGIENRLINGVDQSPTVGIQLGREEERKPEILTLTEIRKLLEMAKSLNHPWYPVWALALLSGMRNGELYALLWQDVDLENGAITVCRSYNTRFSVTKSTKSGHWRTVPISTELRNLLLEIRSTAGDRPEVLPRSWKWTRGRQARELRIFCIGTGLPSVRFHALRACFATQLIRNGVPPIQIQKICGWRDLKTMQRYIRLAGIEIDGATEGLRVLPEQMVLEKASNLFRGSAQNTGV